MFPTLGNSCAPLLNNLYLCGKIPTWTAFWTSKGLKRTSTDFWNIIKLTNIVQQGRKIDWDFIVIRQHKSHHQMAYVFKQDTFLSCNQEYCSCYGFHTTLLISRSHIRSHWRDVKQEWCCSSSLCTDLRQRNEHEWENRLGLFLYWKNVTVGFFCSTRKSGWQIQNRLCVCILIHTFSDQENIGHYCACYVHIDAW